VVALTAVAATAVDVRLRAVAIMVAGLVVDVPPRAVAVMAAAMVVDVRPRVVAGLVVAMVVDIRPRVAAATAVDIPHRAAGATMAVEDVPPRAVVEGIQLRATAVEDSRIMDPIAEGKD